jgi:hypothetical protein
MSTKISKNIIKEIYKYSKENNDKDILAILEKLIKKFYNGVVDHDFLKNKTDKTILKHLEKDLVNFKINKDKINIRANRRARTVKDFIKKNNCSHKQIKTYLDIGCSNGKNTIAVGNILNLKQKNINGVEIDSEIFGGKKIIPLAGFN